MLLYVQSAWQYEVFKEVFKFGNSQMFQKNKSGKYSIYMYVPI